MIRPHFYRLACAAILFLSGGPLLAQTPQPAADSADGRQQAAIKAFEKAGGHFEEHFDPAAGKRVGFVVLNGAAPGKRILKTLADAKNVAWLFLRDSETTDATLKDVREIHESFAPFS